MSQCQNVPCLMFKFYACGMKPGGVSAHRSDMTDTSDAELLAECNKYCGLQGAATMETKAPRFRGSHAFFIGVAQRR